MYAENSASHFVVSQNIGTAKSGPQNAATKLERVARQRAAPRSLRGGGAAAHSQKYRKLGTRMEPQAHRLYLSVADSR